MPTFSHEPDPSAWPPLPPTVSDLSDDDLDFLVSRLLSSDDELGEDSPDVAPVADTSAASITTPASSTAPGEDRREAKNETTQNTATADGMGQVIPFPNRYSWWRIAAVVVLIVGGVGSSFFIPGLFGKTSTPNSNSTHSDANRSNTAVTPRSQPPSTKRSNVDLIAMTSEQQAAAKKAFAGSTDLSNLDVPVAQCLSTINMAHSPVLGAAPVETAQPAETTAQPASPRTKSQLLILGAPLRIVVVEHTCSHGESSVLFRSTLSHGERTG
ncbi:hypothetical protein [uncultured Corynebacterium sp.]|jgi:hypothetical protein|uniref:hypothetical protein n=1 Tax=uncultured Corynebacterium sp. TaxID=159447 RepID=UPI0025DF5DAD|nr:hypothetical protein [uncultured Corynebacterium sp.]